MVLDFERALVEPALGLWRLGVFRRVNCDAPYIGAGDSRAVLSRGGEAVELSRLHTPYDAVESERVRNSGGVVKIVRFSHDPFERWAGRLQRTPESLSRPVLRMKGSGVPYARTWCTCTHRRMQQDARAWAAHSVL